jgi:hypothetical protein
MEKCFSMAAINPASFKSTSRSLLKCLSGEVSSPHSGGSQSPNSDPVLCTMRITVSDYGEIDEQSFKNGDSVVTKKIGNAPKKWSREILVSSGLG